MATALLSGSTNAFRGFRWATPKKCIGRLSPAFGSSHSASPAYQEWPTWHSCFEGHGLNREATGFPPVRSLRIGWGRFVPKASNHSLYRMEQRVPSASYPEGNFGGNQLLDGSISLSPLYPNLTIDLHVRIATVLHQSFPWLQLIQA